jgi:hypothetical protein
VPGSWVWEEDDGDFDVDDENERAECSHALLLLIVSIYSCIVAFIFVNACDKPNNFPW